MLTKSQAKKSRLLPDYFVGSVKDIDFSHLKNSGVRVAFFDLDHTILTHGSVEVDQDIADALKTCGLDVYIATNRRKSTDLEIIKNSIGAKDIMFAKGFLISKPSKQYFHKAAELTDHNIDEIAMVGDRLIQDIWGANKAGLTTVMVEKFGPLRWYDKILTLADRAMAHYFRKYYE